ncbi:uncharacterized protein LOC143921405 [Arctopsyche grandis]|uniref:uncharacterized protein LOC143921405 n=1 Tax=Arctopsyche grandis TaxID=121162 RepID=UPI00406DA20B
MDVFAFVVTFAFASVLWIAVSGQTDERVVTAVAEHLNGAPNRAGRTYSQPRLLDRQFRQESNVHSIGVNFKVTCDSEPCPTDLVKCYAEIRDLGDSLQVLGDVTKCEDVQNVVEVITIAEPVQLTHEIGSGEQFVAVTNKNGGWCANCPTDINTSAIGVQELADDAIIHLSRHKPNSKHTLRKIVNVQRQAQINNGVRYILLLEVDTTACENNEGEHQNEVTHTCLCQVVFLEKPWIKLANGNKFRAVLSNNCTEQYLFGDEGEIVTPNKRGNEVNGDGFNDILKVVHRDELQAAVNPNRNELSEDQIKNIESQIVTDVKEFEETGNLNSGSDSESDVAVQRRVGEQLAINEPDNQSNVQMTIDEAATTPQTVGLSDDKKQAFDGLMDFFGFDQEPSGFPSANDDVYKQDNFQQNFEYQKSVTTKRSAESDSSSSEEKKLTYNEHVQLDENIPVQKDSSEEVDSSEEKIEFSPIVSRTKRSIVSARSNSDGEIMRLAKLATETLDHFDSDDLKRVVLEVLSSKKFKKGSASTYFIKMKVATSKCLESVDNDEKCSSLLSNDKTTTCHVQVEVKSNGDTKVIKSNCSKDDDSLKRSKRGLTGAPAPVAITDAEIQKLAHKSLAHFDLTSSNEKLHRVMTIKSATRQVVAGTLTKIIFEAKETSCGRNDVKALESCPVLDEAILKICTASIWERLWLENGTDITIKCEEAPARRKRSTEMDQIKRLEKLILDEKLFGKFLVKYNRNYMNDRDEYRKRFKIFRENLDLIDELNENERGTAKYGPNTFGDLSPEEFRQTRLGLRTDLRLQNSVPMMHAQIPDVKDLPDSFDWRDKGAVTPVKNQGSCGSCWAFSVTGNIEGQYEIKNGKLLSLSEQELVDCDKLDDGCNGGLPDNAYRAIEQMGGLELENDYPYDAADEKCHFNKTLARVQISGAVNISSNETDMQKWLVQNGPISIGINANAMQFYMGGVSHPFKFLCNPGNLDHGVLIVGYGIHTYPLFKKSMPYWIVKNSWGESWGERGYYRVYRGDGTCGVNMMASSAII